MNYFLYKLMPPRADFDRTMSEREKAAMSQHIGYWSDQTEEGTALVFGPVADPAGVWGLAIVAAESEDDVRQFGDSDPAVSAGIACHEVYAMPSAVVSGSATAPSWSAMTPESFMPPTTPRLSGRTEVLEPLALEHVEGL